jgi:hypothetical protein
MKRLQRKSPQNRKNNKKPTTTRMCTWNPPMHGTKALENTHAQEISSTKAIGATKAMKKERGCF